MLFIKDLIPKLEMISIKKKKLAILIPAAGKGVRANLQYPKTLHPINRIPIIVRIIKKISKYSDCISIVINKKNDNHFKKTLSKFKISKIEFLYQNKAKGMGDAVLKYFKSKNYTKISDIILIWGDIPFLTRSSIDKLLRTHIIDDNFMTILSKNVSNPYTYILKDKKDIVCNVIETHKTLNKYNYGERDIGVFIFKKELLIHLIKKHNFKRKEHNFLYIVNKLYTLGYKIKSLPIAKYKETVSLNSLSDLK